MSSLSPLQEFVDECGNLAVAVGIDEVAHLLGGFPEGGVVLPAAAEDLLGKADELGGLEGRGLGNLLEALPQLLLHSRGQWQGRGIRGFRKRFGLEVKLTARKTRSRGATLRCLPRPLAPPLHPPRIPQPCRNPAVLNGRACGLSPELVLGMLKPTRSSFRENFMQTTVTVRLAPDLATQLEAACQESGKSRSAIIREALGRQFQLQQFRSLRRELQPHAIEAGILSEADALEAIS